MLTCATFRFGQAYGGRYTGKNLDLFWRIDTHIGGHRQVTKSVYNQYKGHLFMMLREPAARAVSYYYNKCGFAFRQASIANLFRSPPFLGPRAHST